MAQVKITDATPAQLLWFAQVRLSLKNIKPNTGRDKLVKAVTEVWGEDFIETDEQMPPNGNAGPQSQRGGYSKPPVTKRDVDPLRFGARDPLVNLKIHADRTKGGSRPVPCHLNGVEYWIPRNENVEVPYRYFLVLQECEGDIHDGWDDDLKRNSDARTTHSYTFTVNRMPSQAEIDAWQARMEPHYDKQRRQKMNRIRRTRRALQDDYEDEGRGSRAA